MATMAEEKPAGTKVDAGVVAEPFRQQVKNRNDALSTLIPCLVLDTYAAARAV